MIWKIFSAENLIFLILKGELFFHSSDLERKEFSGFNSCWFGLWNEK